MKIEYDFELFHNNIINKKMLIDTEFFDRYTPERIYLFIFEKKS